MGHSESYCETAFSDLTGMGEHAGNGFILHHRKACSPDSIGKREGTRFVMRHLDARFVVAYRDGVRVH
ncbi:MAG: hypothetical protein IPO56_17140 [Flavobacteriales bacterium]|nr:hypothetical protein [Flavobacteriales bacterium]